MRTRLFKEAAFGRPLTGDAHKLPGRHPCLYVCVYVRSFTHQGPDESRQPELVGRTSLVRELHVYGTAVAVHARDTSKFQHQG